MIHQTFYQVKHEDDWIAAFNLEHARIMFEAEPDDHIIARSAMIYHQLPYGTLVKLVTTKHEDLKEAVEKERPEYLLNWMHNEKEKIWRVDHIDPIDFQDVIDELLQLARRKYPTAAVLVGFPIELEDENLTRTAIKNLVAMISPSKFNVELLERIDR